MRHLGQACFFPIHLGRYATLSTALVFPPHMFRWFQLGEAVRESRKGVVQRHVPDVERFFKGCHVRIAARVEDDVDEKVLLAKVAKSSGTPSVGLFAVMCISCNHNLQADIHETQNYIPELESFNA